MTVAFYKNVISNLMSGKCCSIFRPFMDKALSMRLLRKSFEIVVHGNALIRTFKIMSFCLKSVVALDMEVKIKNFWVQSENL